MRILIPACLLLSACAGLPQDIVSSTTPVSQPETLWGRAMARYSDRQSEALDFAIRCDAALASTIQPCDVAVDEIAELDRLAGAVQEDGEQALLRQDLPRLNEAIRDLDAVGDEISQTMMKDAR